MTNATSHHITTEHSGSVSGSDGTKQSDYILFYFVIKLFSHVPPRFPFLDPLAASPPLGVLLLFSARLRDLAGRNISWSLSNLEDDEFLIEDL